MTFGTIHDSKCNDQQLGAKLSALVMRPRNIWTSSNNVAVKATGRTYLPSPIVSTFGPDLECRDISWTWCLIQSTCSTGLDTFSQIGNGKLGH